MERKKNGMSELSTKSVSLTAEAKDMKFSAGPKGADGNGMGGVCFDDDVP